MNYKRIYINAKSLVEFFGGATNMAAHFSRYNFERLDRHTIYKWAERGSMPVERWLQAEHIAIKEGSYADMRKQCVLTTSPVRLLSNEEEQLE